MERSTHEEDWLRKEFMRLCGLRGCVVFVLLNNDNNNIMREISVVARNYRRKR